MPKITYKTEAKYLIIAALISACMHIVAILGVEYNFMPDDRLPVTYALVLLNLALAATIFKKPGIVEELLSRYGLRILLLSAIGFVLGWMLYESMIMRRVFFTNMTLLALLPAVRPLINFMTPLKNPQQSDKPLARVLLILLLAVIVIPGFVLPPFWDGIPGWRSGRVPMPKEAVLTGYKLIRDDGASVWYSPSVIGTITYFGSWNQQASLTPERRLAFEEFLWRRYTVNYPLLEQGLSPNQRYLGNFAFPHHTPFRMFDYAQFPPSRIRSLDFVIERFDVAGGKLLERTSTQSLKVRE